MKTLAYAMIDGIKQNDCSIVEFNGKSFQFGIIKLETFCVLA